MVFFFLFHNFKIPEIECALYSKATFNCYWSDRNCNSAVPTYTCSNFKSWRRVCNKIQLHYELLFQEPNDADKNQQHCWWISEPDNFNNIPQVSDKSQPERPAPAVFSSFKKCCITKKPLMALKGNIGWKKPQETHSLTSGSEDSCSQYEVLLRKT